VKERPILFSGPMVKAILEGRKTQTRRVVKPQPIPDRHFPDGRLEWNPGKLHYTECNVNWRPLSRAFDDYIQNGHCPFGAPGDRLWVRETYALTQFNKPVYRSDFRDKDGYFWYSVSIDPHGVSWKPSIHMPRWASRITLEIESLRVERLREISEEDAVAEGVVDSMPCGCLDNGTSECSGRCRFKYLWQSINGPRLPANPRSRRYARVKRYLEKHPDMSWNANPWVWVITFQRVNS